ncbi:MAG: helix-turn-helix domain-containing protein [Pseudomonadota bacterium]
MKPRDTPDELEQRDEATGRSLRRGLQVLDAVLNSGQEGVRVIDLCRICGLQRAPVYRLLATLIECGYVQQQGRFRYVAGPQVGTLVPPGGESDLAARLQPVLARISAACGDAAFAVVRDGSLSHCIARQIGTHPVQILAVEVGTRQPLGVGAAGLALLSALPPDEADAVTRASSEALARFGGMTSARMDLLVRATRERGWSVVGNHAVKGAMGVGMALCAPDGTPIAGISVAAAMGRMPKERQQLIAGVIRKALAALPPKLR